MTVINMVEAKKMIIACYQANESLLLLGPPGMGKTALFEEAARTDLKVGYVCNIMSQKDPVDIGGMRIPDQVTGFMRHFAPEDLPVVDDAEHARHPERGILHYDEINVVSMLMQATAYGIIQERRIGLKKLKPGWVPMASGNNLTDRSAAQKISLALANRFNVQQVRPDLKAWLEQYGSKNVDTRGTAYLRFRPKFFHVMPGEKIEEDGGRILVPADDIRFPTARSWTKAFKFIDQPPQLRRKFFAGYVGETVADDFEAFWRVMENAPTMDEIIAQPKKARLPAENDAGTYYAVAGMLARLVDRKNISQVMVYVDRMLPDYQVALIQDATRRDPGLKQTQAYAQWAVKNQHVTA